MRRRRLLANRLYANPKLSRGYLQHGTLLKWIAMLKLRTVSGKLTWEASHSRIEYKRPNVVVSNLFER